MTFPAFQNKWYIAIFILVTLALGLLQAGLFSPIIDIPFGWLLLDGIIFSTLLAGISIPLYMIARYVDFEKSTRAQRWLNNIALCLLTIIIWIGMDMIILYLSIPLDYFHKIKPTIPLRIMSGILLYMILSQHHITQTKKEKAVEEEDEKEELSNIISEEEEKEVVEAIDRVAVKVGRKIHVIPIADIQYIQADGDYVMIHTQKGKFIKEQTMKYFEQHLPSQKFVRVHRSCIVNVEIISRVELYEKQNYLLSLQDGQKIKASTNGYRLLKKTLSL